jgi:anthranilate synthase component 1
MQISPDNQLLPASMTPASHRWFITRLVADLETPVSAFMKLTRNAPYRFLLESVEGGAVRGRYSMIGMKPDLIWRVNGDKAEINTRASIDPDGPFVELDEPPLTSLRSLLAANHIDVPDDLPPMAAGLFGYMGYDLVRQMERLPEPNEDVLHVPDALMIRPTIMAIFDAVKDEVTVVTPVFPEDDVSAKAAYARACDRLEAVVDAFDRPLDLQAFGETDAEPIAAPRSNISPDDYMDMIRTAKDYISAGDIFPGCAVAALRDRVHPAAVLAVPGTAPGEPLPVPVSPRIRPLYADRLQPGNSGARARRQGNDPPARRNPSAWRNTS